MTALGICLRELRDRLGLTQKDVAINGEMTQAQLSKIESGTITPDIYKLNYLACRYGVPLDYFQPYFMGGKYMPDHNLSQQFEDTRLVIKRILRYQKYADLQAIIQKEQANPLFKNPLYYPYFQWLRGIVELECHKDPEKAMSYFDLALSSSPSYFLREQSAEILNSKGIYFISIGKPDEAKDFLRKGLKLIQPLVRLQNPEIKIRLLYNLSICDYQVENFKHSILNSQQALVISEEIDSYYPQAELFKNLDIAREKIHGPDHQYEQIPQQT